MRYVLVPDNNAIHADKTCPKCGHYYFQIDLMMVDGVNQLGTWFTCKDFSNNEVCGSTLLILSVAQKALLKKHGRLK